MQTYAGRIYGGLGELDFSQLKSLPRAADRPHNLDPIAAVADIPVVQVAGRVAMAGNHAHALVCPKLPRRVVELAVLVGKPFAGDALQVVHDRQPAVDGEGLEAGVGDRPPGSEAHDGGQHEQRVLVAGIVLWAQHAPVVGVHEHVGAALQLVPEVPLAASSG